MSSTVTLALVSAAPAVIIAWLAYWRGTKKDRDVAKSTVAAAESGMVGQVIAAMNQLIDQLQEDNANWRANVKELGVRLGELVAERDACRKELDVLRRKYANDQV